MDNDSKAKPSNVVRVTIQAGTSLSNIADCSSLGGIPVRVLMPVEWTPAHLTFQVSPDGTYFYDLFDEAGGEVTMTVVPGAAVSIQSPTFIGYVKIRSGRRDDPINQAADRTIGISLG